MNYLKRINEQETVIGDGNYEIPFREEVMVRSMSPYQQEFFFINSLAEYTIARINIERTHIKFTWPGGSTNNVRANDLLGGTFDGSAEFEFSKNDKVIDPDDRLLIEEAFPWMKAVARIAEEQEMRVPNENDMQTTSIYQGLTGTYEFSYNKDGRHEILIPSLRFTGTYEELKKAGIDVVLIKLDPSANLNRALLCMEERRKWEIESDQKKGNK